MIKINAIDNVAVMDDGHKRALCDVKSGENIIKYGYPIGRAVCDIQSGESVHSHNLKTNLSGIVNYSYTPELKEISKLPDIKFNGYPRSDGNVGVRNEIWILNTVGCVNKTCEILAKLTDSYAFPHPYGCSQLGDDLLLTQKILAGLVKNPNAGGVLVIGLGCEGNYVDSFKKILGGYNPERVKFLVTQEVEDEIGEGVKLIEELSRYTSSQTRRECSISKLKVGLKCGGSDAFSGITANPVVGGFSDILIARGGSAVLTEVPEMFGAETILMNLCVNEELFNKTVNMINNFKEYYIRYGQPIYENPSPGNKAGGITTLEEKSLGCILKGGTSNVADVIGMGEQVKEQGLTLMDGPGNDIVSSTNLAAAGCQMILFTTGRGTPFGSIVPTVKISTANALAQKKPHWIDFNAAMDNKDISGMLFDLVMRVASGEETNNEKYGCREIAIFKDGVTL